MAVARRVLRSPGRARTQPVGRKRLAMARTPSRVRPRRNVNMAK